MMKDERSARKIRRAKLYDTLFAYFIQSGGILIIVSVLGILVMIVKVALPLFYEPQLDLLNEFASEEAIEPLYFGMDDYAENLMVVDKDLTVKRFDLKSGSQKEIGALPGLEGRTLRNFSVSGYGDNRFAVFHDRGVLFYVVRYEVKFEEQTRRIFPRVELAQAADAEFENPSTAQAAFDEDEGTLTTVEQTATDRLRVLRLKRQTNLLGEVLGSETEEFPIESLTKGKLPPSDWEETEGTCESPLPRASWSFGDSKPKKRRSCCSAKKR